MSIPMSGYVSGIGMVRILSVSGDHFHVLDSRDMRRHVHRDRIKFRREVPRMRRVQVGEYADGTKIETEFDVYDLINNLPKASGGE